MDECATDVRDHAQGAVWVSERAGRVKRARRELADADVAADPAST